MIVKEGVRVRVLWGLEAKPGKVTKVLKNSGRTRYLIQLDDGRCCTTTIDGILEP
jgi:hypothetical protein